MKSGMTPAEFVARIEAADEELVRQGVPVFQRLHGAFRLLAPDYSGEISTSPTIAARFPDYVGPRLLIRISEWYAALYGARYNMPSDLARVPILIKGQIYLARIPLTFGAPALGLDHVFGLVEGMTPSLAAALSDEDRLALMTAWISGFQLVYEMDDVRSIPPGSVSPETLTTARGLLDSAFLDRAAAAHAFESPHGDLPTACFHAQQMAEKMLKMFALLRGLASEKELKSKFKHGLKDLATACESASPDFTSVAQDVALLSTITMDIRYTPPPIRSEEAAKMVWAALRIAGLTACQILGHERRFTPEPFAPHPSP